MDMGEILLGGLVGAAYATGRGGIAWSFRIVFVSNVASSAYQQKALKAIVCNGLIDGLIAGIAYGAGQWIGRAVFKNSDLVFSDNDTRNY